MLLKSNQIIRNCPCLLQRQISIKIFYSCNCYMLWVSGDMFHESNYLISGSRGKSVTSKAIELSHRFHQLNLSKSDFMKTEKPIALRGYLNCSMRRKIAFSVRIHRKRWIVRQYQRQLNTGMSQSNGGNSNNTRNKFGC